jgi:hypothetical protein
LKLILISFRWTGSGRRDSPASDGRKYPIVFWMRKAFALWISDKRVFGCTARCAEGERGKIGNTSPRGALSDEGPSTLISFSIVLGLILIIKSGDLFVYPARVASGVLKGGQSGPFEREPSS